jgi:hypothetical protein
MAWSRGSVLSKWLGLDDFLSKGLGLEAWNRDMQELTIIKVHIVSNNNELNNMKIII